MMPSVSGMVHPGGLEQPYPAWAFAREGSAAERPRASARHAPIAKHAGALATFSSGGGTKWWLSPSQPGSTLRVQRFRKPVFGLRRVRPGWGTPGLSPDCAIEPSTPWMPWWSLSAAWHRTYPNASGETGP